MDYIKFSTVHKAKGVEFFVNRTYENLLEFNEKLLLPSTSN